MQDFKSVTVVGIDQSISGSGVAVLRSAFGHQVERLSCRTIRSELRGIRRISDIVNKIVSVAMEAKADVVCMEDVTRMASSASLTPLTELAGCIKLKLFEAGFKVRVQNQSQMKKFNLGQGNVSKDSGYMLKVADATGERFEDDNQGDAFMHAKLCLSAALVANRTRDIKSYTRPQQEVLMAAAVKESDLSQARFNKLPEDEKILLLLRSLELDPA